jgi:hypothetical protein
VLATKIVNTRSSPTCAVTCTCERRQLCRWSGSAQGAASTLTLQPTCRNELGGYTRGLTPGLGHAPSLAFYRGG